MSTPLKIAVLVSGGGTNLQTLINAQQSGELPIEIVGVISNREDAYAIERAKAANIDVAVLSHVPSGKRMAIKTFEKHALKQLNQWQPELIVLAGFMRVLSGEFIDACPVTMINLHPSLLPKFKGLDTHARAIAAGEGQHGCSVHIVTSELDAGQVLTQAVLDINAADSADSLQQRVHELEYQLLPFTIAMIANGLFIQKNAPGQGIRQRLSATQTDTVASCLPKLPWQLKMDN